MPEDTLVLFSDGVPEARRPEDDEQFGFDRLEASLRRHAGQGPERVRDGVLADLRDFTGDVERDGRFDAAGAAAAGLILKPGKPVPPPAPLTPALSPRWGRGSRIAGCFFSVRNHGYCDSLSPKAGRGPG